jgi:hypothetical protein
MKILLISVQLLLEIMYYENVWKILFPFYRHFISLILGFDSIDINKLLITRILMTYVGSTWEKENVYIYHGCKYKYSI